MHWGTVEQISQKDREGCNGLHQKNTPNILHTIGGTGTTGDSRKEGDRGLEQGILGTESEKKPKGNAGMVTLKGLGRLKPPEGALEASLGDHVVWRQPPTTATAPNGDRYTRVPGCTDQECRQARVEAMECPVLPPVEVRGGEHALSVCEGEEVLCVLSACGAPDIPALSDTGATSVYLTPASVMALGLKCPGEACGRRVAVQTAADHVLQAEPIAGCEVALCTMEGQWVCRRIRDAYRVPGIARDVVGGPAISSAGFDAVYLKDNMGAFLVDRDGIRFPLQPAPDMAPGHYTLRMRPAAAAGAAVPKSHALAVTGLCFEWDDETPTVGWGTTHTGACTTGSTSGSLGWHPEEARGPGPPGNEHVNASDVHAPGKHACAVTTPADVSAGVVHSPREYAVGSLGAEVARREAIAAAGTSENVVGEERKRQGHEEAAFPMTRLQRRMAEAADAAALPESPTPTTTCTSSPLGWHSGEARGHGPQGNSNTTTTAAAFHDGDAGNEPASDVSAVPVAPACPEHEYDESEGGGGVLELHDAAGVLNEGEGAVAESSMEKKLSVMYERHLALNHAGKDLLNTMVKNKEIKGGTIISDIDCDACAIANAVRASHSSRPLPVPTTKPGAWMFFDILGPFHEPCEYGAYRYVFAGIDSATGFVFKHFMQKKDEVVQGYLELRKFFHENDAYVCAKHGMKEFRLDKFLMDKDSVIATVNGHAKSELVRLLDADGVRPQFTPSVNCPELNGKIERFWRTLQTKREAILLASGAPRATYGFCAMQHFVFTYNRMPTNANKLGGGVAPYETLGIPFDRSKLVPFYSPATLWAGPQGPKGVAPKAIKVRVVGYRAEVPGFGYICEDLERHALVCSDNVRVRRVHGSPGERAVSGRGPDGGRARASSGVVPPLAAPLTTDGEMGSVVRLSGNRALTRRTGTSLNDNPCADLSDPRNAARDMKEAEKHARAVIRKAWADADKVVVQFTQNNPKAPRKGKPPSKSCHRYESYKKCITMKEIAAKLKETLVLPSGEKVRAMLEPDLVFDLTRGYVKLRFPPDPHKQAQEQIYCAKANEWLRKSSLTQTGTRESTSDVVFPTMLALMAATLVTQPPVVEEVRNLAEAQASPQWAQWEAARHKELSGLIERGVWTVVRREEVPVGAKVFPLKEIHDVVYTNKDGVRTVKKFKHRVTFRGDRSKHERDYFETASCMARAESVRMVVSIATALRWDLWTIDHTQAFTQAPRDVELHTELPEMSMEEQELLGMPGKCREFVGKLNKTLYGEKSAGRAWQVMYDNWLVNDLGATMVEHDRQVFIWRWNGHIMYMPTHVDDGLIAASDPAVVHEFVRRASEVFDVTGPEKAETILGMSIIRDGDITTISQEAYARSLMDKFDIWSMSAMESPLVPNDKFVPHEGEPVEQHDYMVKLGALNWLACNTRPDLAYAASRLARAARNPGPWDHEMMIRTLRYLKGTLELGITYHASSDARGDPYPLENKLVGAVDSNYYHNGDKATSGSVCLLNGGAVAWRSTRQSVVTTSSTHAEVTAASEFVQSMVWLRDMMKDFGLDQPTTRIIVDNKAVCDQTVSGTELRKTDHYKSKQGFLEQSVRKKFVWLDHTPGRDNPADIMTKSISVKDFKRHRDTMLGIKPAIPLSDECRKIFEKGRNRYVNGGHVHTSES